MLRIFYHSDHDGKLAAGADIGEELGKMKATLVLEGKWKVSKQNSYCARPRGGKFKNPAYAAEQVRMLTTIHPQLVRQGWSCTRNQVYLKITFHGPCMPVDFDNCGLIPDCLQGISREIGGKRMRGPGPAVWDDRQFCPVTVDWKKGAERRIILELEEIKNGNENAFGEVLGSNQHDGGEKRKNGGSQN